MLPWIKRRIYSKDKLAPPPRGSHRESPPQALSLVGPQCSPHWISSTDCPVDGPLVFALCPAFHPVFAKLSLFSHGALLFSFTEQLLSYLLQYMVDSMASALSNSDVCLFNSGKLSSCAQASSPTCAQQNAPLRREQGPFQSSPHLFPSSLGSQWCPAVVEFCKQLLHMFCSVCWLSLQQGNFSTSQTVVAESRSMPDACDYKLNSQ